jgi:carbamoyl-phosphate synthase small subunit
MKLTLKDGAVYQGRSFGAVRDAAGEVVFNTGMTGYVETLTDPSYRGQILVLTYPLQGNYGVPADGFESERIQVAGLVVSHYSESPSHHASVRSLREWLIASSVPAIEGVDTRTLTRHLREHGTIGGALSAEPHEIAGELLPSDVVDMANVVELVTPRGIRRYDGAGPHVLVIDTGAKENIIRSLSDRGARVTRAAFFERWEDELDRVDGVLLTNGPGDPSSLPELILRLRALLGRGLPVFGICLGHQLLALAAGATTYKLKYGHRSFNQPVQDLTSGRAYVTSQNHGYAVSTESLPDGWEPWFVNLNDGTNEGIRHATLPLSSVQFHPEAAAGPNDTAWLFDAFLEQARTGRRMERSA